MFVFFISDLERYFFVFSNISFLENLCLNSSKPFLSFLNFLLLTLISSFGISGFGVLGFGFWGFGISGIFNFGFVFSGFGVSGFGSLSDFINLL